MPRAGRAITMVGGATLAGAALVVAYVVRARRSPTACPYGQRVWLDLPRPFFTRARLRQILAPSPGERLLEVGVGTGYYALDIAGWLEPGGTLAILDLQHAMLALTMQRARERRLATVIATQGDAQALPYATGSFDAAYLVATLGEVPDQTAALRELRRVLKPGGRLVVGEGLPDPHMVPLRALRSQADAIGLDYECRLGGRLGYLARLRVPT